MQLRCTRISAYDQLKIPFAEIQNGQSIISSISCSSLQQVLRISSGLLNSAPESWVWWRSKELVMIVNPLRGWRYEGTAEL
jgi:hypothetical protein